MYVMLSPEYEWVRYEQLKLKQTSELFNLKYTKDPQKD